MTMHWTASLLVCAILFQGSYGNSLENLRCLICKQVVEDLQTELKKVDPNRKLDIKKYRLDEASSEVLYALSSLHISDSLEKVCTGIDDYVRATDKKTGELLLLRLIMEGGGMNPKMGEVNIIQDGDLNKSLQYYCNGIAEEGEELLTELFQKGEKNIKEKLCKQELNLCSDKLLESDEDGSRDEL